METTLKYRRGFFGLVAEGWNVTDFGKPWPRGPLPTETLNAELMVGFLDTERASGKRWSADEFREYVATHCAKNGVHHEFEFDLTDESLSEIRRVRGELFGRWEAIPKGAGFILEFDAG